MDFPTLVSAGSAAGSASGAANAASAALGTKIRHAQAIQQAMQQQAKQDEEDRIRQFELRLRMQQDGWIPADTPQGGTIAKGGLGSRLDNPAAQGPGQTMADPWGQKWFKPEQKAVTPQQSFTDLQSALEHHAQVLNPDGSTFHDPNTGTPVAPPPGRVVQVPGGPKVYFPSDDELAADKDRAERTAAANKPDKAERYTYNHSTDAQGNVNITRVGPDQTPEAWNGKEWATLGADNRLAAKQETGGYHYSDDDQGNVHVIRDGKEVGLIKGAGKAKDNSAAEERRQDRAERIEQGRRDRTQRQIETLQIKEQEQHELRRKYGDKLNTPDGEQLIDPDTKKSVTMNAARREQYQRQFERATDMVGVYQAQQRSALRSVNGGEQQQPQQPQTQPQQQPQAAAPTRQPQYRPGPMTRARDQAEKTASSKKLTDKGKALEYIQKAGGDKDKARQLARADGWEF